MEIAVDLQKREGIYKEAARFITLNFKPHSTRQPINSAWVGQVCLKYVHNSEVWASQTFLSQTNGPWLCSVPGGHNRVVFPFLSAESGDLPHIQPDIYMMSESSNQGL